MCKYKINSPFKWYTRTRNKYEMEWEIWTKKKKKKVEADYQV